MISTPKIAEYFKLHAQNVGGKKEEKKRSHSTEQKLQMAHVPFGYQEE